MNRRLEQETAPDFRLPDLHGEQVQLADYRGRLHVVLVLARGFL